LTEYQIKDTDDINQRVEYAPVYANMQKGDFQVEGEKEKKDPGDRGNAKLNQERDRHT